MESNRWEYRRTWIDDVAELNRLGAEGWEAVGLYQCAEDPPIGLPRLLQVTNIRTAVLMKRRAP